MLEDWEALDINTSERERAAKRVIDEAFNNEDAPKKSVSRILIKIAASIISFTASYMSMYYTLSWFASRLPFIQALAMTVIVVGSILLTPQMIKMNLSKPRFSTFMAAFLLSIELLVAAGFSMMTTIGTLYNSQSSVVSESSENIELKAAIEKDVAAREDKIDRLSKVVDMAFADEERYTSRIQQLLDEGVITGNAMATLVANRNKSQASRKEAESEINSLIDKTSASNREGSSIRSERPDFTFWIADRFQIGRDMTELILNAIPALFVDILSPSMLMVAIFL